MNNSLPPLKVKRHTGQELLVDGQVRLGPCLKDFWAWAFSSIMDNTLRGLFAEWLVAVAVGSADDFRVEWGSYDLETPTGIKLEVKSSGYIQSWHQKRLSRISFNIKETLSWSPDTNEFEDEKNRPAEVYVFCVLKWKDKITIRPLDVSQWRFYVISTKAINLKLGGQKTVSLGRLEEIGLIPLEYHQLKEAIEVVNESDTLFS